MATVSPKNRRKVDEVVQAAAGDRLTVQMIVWTVCATCVLLVMTMCKQALTTGDVSEPIDRNVGMVIAALVGWIGKTAADAWRNYRNQQPPSATEIGEAISDVSKKDPITTTEDAQTDATVADTIEEAQSWNRRKTDQEQEENR